MDDCIFCRIAKGEIPSHKIYEDDKTLAFLGINPPVEGFTLVIPKVHSAEMWQMDEADYRALMATVSQVGRRLREEFATARVGLQVEGLEVPHTHVKMLPFDTADQFRALEPKGQPDHDALAALAARLKMV